MTRPAKRTRVSASSARLAAARGVGKETDKTLMNNSAHQRKPSGPNKGDVKLAAVSLYAYVCVSGSVVADVEWVGLRSL